MQWWRLAFPGSFPEESEIEATITESYMSNSARN
jgi:hypothetical protein